MPELPEVEGMRRRVEEAALGQRLVAVEVLDSKLLPPPEASLLGSLTGHRLGAVRRRGKQLALQLGDRVLLIHPRMTGRLGTHHTISGRARLRLHFDRGAVIVFSDPRRLGRARVVWADAMPDSWSGLGPEPWPEVRDGAWWMDRLRGLRGPIKAVLLDQRRVAGVGNIGATEACWHAHVAPWRSVPTLTDAEWRALAQGVRTWITGALEEDGVHGYVSEGGQNPFSVYGRVGQPCPACGVTLERMVLRGRGTVHCPGCQR